jgi:hypothetical protein
MKTEHQNPILGHKGHEISKKSVLFLQLQVVFNRMHLILSFNILYPYLRYFHYVTENST